MDVLTLYESLPYAGRIRNKGNGEYCGPCPSCGGEDRFVLWPEHSSGATGGRFMCRGCGVQGDAVEFLRVFRGMTYREACEALKIESGAQNGVHFSKGTTAKKAWTPRVEDFPSAAWMSQAARFVASCSQGIESGPGADFLKARSLTLETAHALGIGWNAADRYDRRSEWGLDEQTNPETGKPLKIWLPRGLVLPIHRKSGIVALLVRRADWKSGDNLPKYWQVKGSGSFSYCLGKRKLPVVLVESVLDAVLIWQEARDLVAVVALTGAQKRPDAATTDFLKESPLILWSLDFDDAGRKAWPWWKEHFPHVGLWPVAVGKDPGEMVKTGVPVRTWIEAGLARQEGNASPLPGDQKNATKPATTANQSTDEPEATEQQSVPRNGNEGQSGPDYASFCTRYWKGCLGCQDCMAGKLFFCRKWNRENLGSDVVSWKTGTGKPLEEAQRAPELRIARTWCFYCPEWQDSGSCWWIGRCGVDGSRVGHRSECHL